MFQTNPTTGSTGELYSLVAAAEGEVEEYEEERDPRGGADADVEGGVVGEDAVLVVAGELVEAGASHCGLVGEVPGAELVAHVTSCRASHCCSL